MAQHMASSYPRVAHWYARVDAIVWAKSPHVGVFLMPQVIALAILVLVSWDFLAPNKFAKPEFEVYGRVSYNIHKALRLNPNVGFIEHW